MEKKPSPADQNLAESAEKLLAEIASTDHLVEDLPDQTVADIHSQIRRHAMASVDLPQGIPVDARFDVRISEDGMRCTASFYPAIEDGKPLDVDRVVDELFHLNIVYGVNYQTIREAVFQCNLDKVELHDVVITEGKPSVTEVEEHITIEADLLKPSGSIDLEALRIEHKERSPFVFVKRGDLLARRIPRQPGERGWDVHGRELAAPIQRIATVTPGRNVVEKDGSFYAAIDGRFLSDRHSFSVVSVLVIPGNVDYSTGHVDFDGDVVVAGDVVEGFKVKATGSIFCAQTVAATEIECGKDLIVGRGIIGRQNGTVKVGGEIRCKYVEHCYAEARGPIRTIVGAVNSVINTLDSFETGPRGILVGGKVRAQNSVTAGQIGTEMGPPTEIYCGIDFSVLDRLEWIRDRNMELANKLAEVKKRSRSPQAADAALKDLEAKLHDAIRRMNEASVKLVSHLDKNEESTVIARELVHPNTYIEICHASFVVSRRMHATAFRLMKDRSRVEAAPLAKRG